jgi:hypothetical protein
MRFGWCWCWVYPPGTQAFNSSTVSVWLEWTGLQGMLLNGCFTWFWRSFLPTCISDWASLCSSCSWYRCYNSGDMGQVVVLGFCSSVLVLDTLTRSWGMSSQWHWKAAWISQQEIFNGLSPPRAFFYLSLCMEEGFLFVYLRTSRFAAHPTWLRFCSLW